MTACFSKIQQGLIMAWYDSFAEQLSTLPDRASDLVGEYFDAEGDKQSEIIRDAVKQPEIKQPTTAATAYRQNNFNWQMAGVIVGGLGVALTLYRMAR